MSEIVKTSRGLLSLLIRDRPCVLIATQRDGPDRTEINILQNRRRNFTGPGNPDVPLAGPVFPKAHLGAGAIANGAYDSITAPIFVAWCIDADEPNSIAGIIHDSYLASHLAAVGR